MVICYMQFWMRWQIRLHDNRLGNIADHSVESGRMPATPPPRREGEAARAKSISTRRQRDSGASLFSGIQRFRNVLRLIGYYSV
jgi:hypothetical protein